VTDQDDRGQAVLDTLTEIEALIDGKQLPAMLRIKALRRLNCCALAVCGAEEREHRVKPKFLPLVLSAPGSPELRRAQARQLRLLSLTRNSLPPCVASRPCGVSVVAR